MKRNRILPALFVGLCLAGCGGDAGFNETFSSGSGAAEQLQSSVVQGRLKIGGLPIANAEVRLRLNGRVLASATSDRFGSFLFDLEPPAVTAKGTLTADVVATIDGARYSAAIQQLPDFVWVTEISTLVHDYAESHPGVSLEQADAVVGRSLGCPPGEAVELLSDRDIFDPATFQQQADRHGGDAAFFQQVEEGLGVQTYNFAAPDPYESLRLDGQDPHARFEAVQARVGEGELASITTMSALGDNLKSPLGWVIQRLSSNIDPALSGGVTPLVLLQQSLNQLQADLKGQFPGTEWNQALERSGLERAAASLDLYTADLKAALDSRPAPTDTPFLPPLSVAAYLAKVKADIYSIPTAAESANLCLELAAPSDKETVLAYHKLQMASLGHSAPASALGFYDLRYNQLTDKLLDNLNFRLGLARLAMDMLANTAHSSGLVADTRRARELLVRGGSQGDIANRFRRAQQFVPPKLDRDDILVLPPTFPGPVPGTPSLLYRGVWTFGIDYYRTPRELSDRYQPFIRNAVGSPWAETGSNWSVPDLRQMQLLDTLAAAAGNGDALQGLVRLGIYPVDAGEPVHLLYTEAGEVPDWEKVKNRLGEFILEQKTWRLSRPGQPGGPSVLRVASAPEGSYPRSATLGCLFVRGSLSDGTPDQARSLLATGTEVKPRLEVSIRGNRASATALYSFPNGQEHSLDVTDRVAWTSDNPDSIEISNLSDPAFPNGSLLNTQRGGNATITASLLVDPSKAGTPDGYVTSNSFYFSQSGAQLRNLNIFPRNVILSSTGPTSFSCTSFAGRIDGPTHDLADVTGLEGTLWSLLDPNGLPVPSKQATLVNGVLNLVDPGLATGIYTIEVRRGDLMNQAKVGIQLP